MKDVIKALNAERKGHMATVARIDAAIAKLSDDGDGGGGGKKRRKRRTKAEMEAAAEKPSKKDKKAEKAAKKDSKAERRAKALAAYGSEDAE